MVLASSEPRRLGREDARLRFGESSKQEGAWAGRRVLQLDGREAFELSLWCGTCPFLFKRLEGANDRLSIESLQDRLAEGLDAVDTEVIDAFATLLPPASYRPMLLEVTPRLVAPRQPGDYYSEEQVTTWGVDAFWGLPEYPQTPYYRTFETVVDHESHLYQFVVPMVPPSWNDASRVGELRELLARSSRPTAVAVGTLDVCAPAVDDQSQDWYWHWGLSHFVLDGHHKLEAAATAQLPLRLLTLLNVDASLAPPESVAQVEHIRARAEARR